VPTILDQPEKIKAIDKSNMLSHCMKTADYSQEALQLAREVGLPKKRQHQHILIAGMGGSGIGGEILRGWLRDDLRIPIEICNDYTLPAYVNNDTLVFAISYSGNTEETLSAFVDAVRRRCTIITITSGGHLLSYSRKFGLSTITIPRSLPPRVALPYTFFPLPVILSRMGIVSDVRGEIEEAVQTLRKISQENAPQIPVEGNQAKKLACELEGTIPIIYGFREYGAVAHRWKTQFNENSKVPSSYNVFPELNHNETVGWEASENLTKNLSVVLIRDRDEPPEVTHRIEMTKHHALRKAQKILEVYATGETRLAKMFAVLYVGDLVSVYLAILRKVDPTPVRMITKVKTELTKKSGMAKKLAEEIEALAQRIP
jgi:glucose/mannose-6-phosphate isomerase